MVRPVQDDLPGARGDRRGAGGQAPDRQAEHRRQPGRDPPLRRDEHPDPDPVQGRRAQGPPDRGQAQGRSCSRRSRPTCRPAARRRGPRRRGRRRPAPPRPPSFRARPSTPTGIFGPGHPGRRRGVPAPRGLRVDGICGAPDLGHPGRGRLPAGRPLLVPPDPDAAGRRRGRAPAAPGRPGLRHRPGRRDLRRRHRARARRVPAQRRPAGRRHRRAPPPSTSCSGSRAATTSPSSSPRSGPGPPPRRARPPWGAATWPSARAAGWAA